MRGKEGTIATLQAGGSMAGGIIASHQVEGGLVSTVCTCAKFSMHAPPLGTRPVPSLPGEPEPHKVVQKSCMHGIEFVS